MSIESNNVLLKFIFPFFFNEATKKFFTSYRDLLIWIHLSLSSKIQKNYTGLKISGCTGVRVNSGQKDTKKPKNPNATFEEPGAKAGVVEQKQVSVRDPCTQHHQRNGQNT